MARPRRPQRDPMACHPSKDPHGLQEPQADPRDNDDDDDDGTGTERPRSLRRGAREKDEEEEEEEKEQAGVEEEGGGGNRKKSEEVPAGIMPVIHRLRAASWPP